MPDLIQDVESVTGLLTQSGDVAAEADSTLRQAIKQSVEIGERILAGETTGDRIMDYVILRHRLPNKKIVATYRDLEALLQQHVGELVLVVTREERSAVLSTFAREPDVDDYVIGEQIKLGVIKDSLLAINLEHQQCAITVGSVAFTFNRYTEEPRTLEGGCLYPEHWDFSYLGQPLECKNPANRKRGVGPLMLEVIVGDAEVAQWFATCTLQLQMAFWKAMQLLHHPITDTPAVLAELEQRRQLVTGDLLELVWGRHLLRLRGGYAARGLNLEQVEQRIRKELALAVELGMTDCQLLSVRDLCQEYKIETE
jgi:hypothetical protein